MILKQKYIMLCGYGIFWYTLNCYFKKIQTNYPLIKGAVTPKKFIKATFKYVNNEKSLTLNMSLEHD
jgi:hypothetical protein